jgi:hypothetical protein
MRIIQGAVSEAVAFLPPRVDVLGGANRCSTELVDVCYDDPQKKTTGVELSLSLNKIRI